MDAHPESPAVLHVGGQAQGVPHHKQFDKALAGFVSVACFLSLAWLFWPGIMTLDSFRPYGQALTHEYNTWHPVFMALLWSALNAIHRGPQSLFVLNLSLQTAALFLVARAAIRRGLPHAWALCLLGFLPFLSNFTGVLVKDSVLCAMWLFGFAILFRAHLSAGGTTRSAFALSLVPLAGGFLVRPFSALALVPLVAFGCIAAGRGSMRSTSLARRTTVVCCCVWLLAPALTLLSRARPNSAVPQLFLWDLAGISLRAGVDVFPDYIRARPEHSLATVKTHFTPVTAPTLLHLGWGLETVRTREQVYQGPLFTSYLARDMQEHKTELVTAWSSALIRHPAAYLRHRLEVARSLLRFGYGSGFAHAYVDHWRPDFEEPSVPPRGAASMRAMRLWIGGAERAFPALFKPWFWLALNLMALGFARASSGDAKIRAAAFALSVSALCYVAPLFLLTPSSDFRYVYWAVWATGLSLALLVMDEWRRDAFAAGRMILKAAALVAGLAVTERFYGRFGPPALLPGIAGIGLLVSLRLARRGRPTSA